MVSLRVNNELLLRSYRLGDEEELFAAIDASRTFLDPWLSWVKATMKTEHSKEFIENALHQADTQQGLALGIWVNEQLSGGIGMHQWDHATNRAQLGYWLAADKSGKGVIQQSMVRFIDFLFSVTALTKLEIHYVTANLRSAKVADRLGFRLEGVIRQAILRNGLPEDLAITGILKHEWQAMHPISR